MNKTVLITGASGGIGSALCREFAENGYDIILHYFSKEEKAEALAKELRSAYGGRVQTVKADLRKEEDVKRLAEKALSFGEVDVLINNAGTAYFSLFQLADDNKVKELFDLNLMSAMSLTKEILPCMIKNHRGRIINISSMWGLCGASCEVHYSASKAAIIGFTKALAKEAGPSDITVNCIAPGFIDTEMNANIDEESAREIVSSTPLCRKGKPEDISPLAVFLASDKASFITGQVIAVDGGLV